jgi:ketosteroid isomerase-like protein
MKAFSEGYAGRDLEAVLALHTLDPDLVTLTPEGKHVGPDALRALVEHDLSQFEAINWSYGWTSVSAAGPVAWVAADATLNLQGGGPEITLVGSMTMIFERREGKWLIAHGHVSFQPHK